MPLKIEITQRFDQREDADKLLYTPRGGGLAFRRTKTYWCEVAGDQSACAAWMRRVLLDEISQDLHLGDQPALAGAAAILEFGMKPGALDHEREMILAEYHREGDDALGFRFDDLRLRTRIYLFATTPGSPVDPAPFVKDIVNPAVHTHRLVPPA
jgi:hypothetical protein